MKIPKNHPRKQSLEQRKALEIGLEKGITAKAGLIAFGRGEAFDYLLGEKTTLQAKKAISAAAAQLLLSKRPVISVNGNTAVIAPKQIVSLSKTINAKIEANIFYPPKKRRALIANHLKKFGTKVFGVTTTKKLANLSSNRALVDEKGIWIADTVLIAIEDGDRTETLKKAGKKVIAIDLNPKSRTATKADITIVDNAVRSFAEIEKDAKKLSNKNSTELKQIVKNFNNKKNLQNSLKIMRGKL